MKALIVVDVQNDFVAGGALAVPRGDEVIEPIVAAQGDFEVVVATQDWHPPGHGSFASSHPGRRPGDVIDLHGVQQVLWPDHCVQGTAGAAFSAALGLRRLDEVFRKGMDPEVDSYSGFFDNCRKNDTGMSAWLRGRGVDEVWLCGLALDYCVKATALDACSLGFRTTVLVEACRAVELSWGDGDRAVRELRAAGVEVK